MTSSGQRILRLKSVLDKTGDSKAGLYSKLARGVFPKPIKLSDRAVGWLESEVEQWISDRVKFTREREEEVTPTP